MMQTTGLRETTRDWLGTVFRFQLQFSVFSETEIIECVPKLQFLPVASSFSPAQPVNSESSVP